MLCQCRGRLRWKHLHGRVLRLLLVLLLLVLLLLLNMVLWLNMILLRLRLLKLLMVLHRDRCGGGGDGGRRIAAKLLGHLAHDARERCVRRPRAHA